MKYIYGPIPSRRLGQSLGISPISKKTCNLACVYCMLGNTDKMTNDFVYEYPANEILDEVKIMLKKAEIIDVITIVGEGEPTLYLKLGELITKIKELTDIPVAVITNGTLLTEDSVYQALLKADIVLPSIDAYDELSFKLINRPHKALNYQKSLAALIKFSHEYQGQIWLETMIMSGYNDSLEAVEGFKIIFKKIRYDRLYLNSPVRPPAISTVKSVDHDLMDSLARSLNGINIDLLADPNFHSEIVDDYEAILSIIKRHPMNQFEISSFLKSRNNLMPEAIFTKLNKNSDLIRINYKSYDTYRFK
jgi:wyosine [tRNA(Phe)-imidazoG37] synthetase (radical SAM superfamily)